MNIPTEKDGGPLKGRALYDAARGGCIFVENGLAGVKDADGNVIIRPSYGQICWEGETLAMKHYDQSGYSFRYLHPSGGESSSIGRENEFGIFTRDGMVGLDDGRIRIPPEYDEVFPWGKKSDVYYLRKGDKGMYINHSGERILTEFARFTGIDDIEPYYVYEKQNSPVVIVMELAGDRRDGQTCLVEGEWVRLERHLKTEMRSILSQPADIKSIPEDSIEDFYSPFTYIYSAYLAHSKARRPIADCIEQLRRMGCFESTWFYHLVVSVGEGTDLASIDLDEIDLFFGGLRKNTRTRAYAVGVRMTQDLKKDEVQVFCLLSFTDRWPSKEEYAFWGVSECFDMVAAENTHAAWLESIDALKAPENVKDAMRKDANHWPSVSVEVPDGIDEVSIVAFCDFLKSRGSDYRAVVYDGCDHFRFNDELTDSQVDGVETVIRWAVRNGADPSFVRDGESGLDVIEGFIKCDVKKSERYTKQLHRIRDLVLSLGGKSAEAVLQERLAKCQPKDVAHGRKPVASVLIRKGNIENDREEGGSHHDI